MLCDARDFCRDFLRGEHEIHTAGGHRTLRHAIDFRALILSEGDAARRLDLLKAQGAVRRCAREHHADRLVAAVGRQRAEKLVDPAVEGTALLRQQHQFPLRDDHIPAGRDHINLIGLDRRLLTDLMDLHLRGPGQQLCKNAFVSG